MGAIAVTYFVRIISVIYVFPDRPSIAERRAGDIVVLHEKRALSRFHRELGERLRNHRVALSLSQEALAWEVDVAQATISNYENGRHDIPVSVLIALCRALGASPLELVPDLASHPVEQRTKPPDRLAG
jgi:DNA-binding XRE family transcriptional regulator